MSYRIAALRTGKPQPGRLSRRGQPVATTFGRTRTPEAVRVTQAGIDGDRVGDPSVHGGEDRAILFYALSNYAYWANEFGISVEEAIERGFGENITIEGTDEREVCVGDIVQIGEVVLEVNQPRSPCWKIGAYWKVPTLTKDVYRTGRSGWFARVLQDGSIDASLPVELTARPNPGLTIGALNDAIVEIETHGGDPGEYAELAAKAAACEALAPNWRNDFIHVPQH